MKLEKKKVLLLNFPLLDVGGIVTWSHQIIKGFAKLGIQADHYYCTPTGRYKVSETEFIPIGDKFKRGEKIPSKTLGFHGEENIKIYKELLNQYDYVIFIHPSPHPTKANKKDERMSSWQNLYTECHLPKVVIFHDKKWHKTNAWFKEVHDSIDVILAAQHNFIDSVNEYAGLDGRQDCFRMIKATDWLYFPIDMQDQGWRNEDKQKQLCMMPQWIKWKNHEKLLNEAACVPWPIHFYNGGMEYHKLGLKDCWNSIRVDWVEDCYVNSAVPHEYHGFVTYSKVKEVYRKSYGAIDLTTRTYQNYTHHESCLYGAVLLCTEECRQGPYNHIHDGEYWPVDIKDISNSINHFMDISEDSRLQIVKAACQRTMENFECSKIAKKINDIVESI